LDVICKTVGSDVIVIHAKKRITCKLMGSAALIWQGIESGFSREQIVGSILFHYDTNFEFASAEVDELILRLATSSFILPKDAAVATDTIDKNEIHLQATRKPYASEAIIISKDGKQKVRLEPVEDFENANNAPRVARITVDAAQSKITQLPLGQIALTFDDGPHPVFTVQILDILDRSSIRANFFLIGAQAERNPHLVEEICSRGHIVGSHSYDHTDLTTLDLVSAQENILKGHDVIQRLSGTNTPFFRFPYLRSNRALESFLCRRGILPVFTDINPKDWRASEADEIVNSLAAEFDQRRSGVVTLHSFELTARALPRIIEMLAPKTEFAYFDWQR
ncbi:MAG: polysaccharide deacetylase family protein, partial [Terriglobales bacterium]